MNQEALIFKKPKGEVKILFDEQIAKAEQVLAELKSSSQPMALKHSCTQRMQAILSASFIENEKLKTELSKVSGMGSYHINESELSIARRWLGSALTSFKHILENFDLYEEGLSSNLKNQSRSETPRDLTKIFVVHGQNKEHKHHVARFISEKLKLEPIILEEQPNEGNTLIEKFEQHSDVSFAVVLMSGDDEGYPRDKPEQKKLRARQNVVLELGYFAAKLGRKNIAVLCEENVERPSDINGMVYTLLDPCGAWKMELGKELQTAGFEIDLNKL
jgi:predicted nucleotide-binding protein